jgi:hypothetical protein
MEASLDKNLASLLLSPSKIINCFSCVICHLTRALWPQSQEKPENYLEFKKAIALPIVRM